MRQILRILASLVTLHATHVCAFTVRAPDDLGELARQSDAVVLARALAVESTRHGGLIFTQTRFHVARDAAHVIETGTTIVVETPGGELEDLAWHVEGFPRFRIDESYLLFLRQARNGTWRLFVGARGAFPEAALAHENLFERIEASIGDGSTLGVAPDELAAGLVAKGGGAGEFECAFILSRDGHPRRWETFDDFGQATILASEPANDPLGNYELVADALAMWTDIEGTSLNLTFGGFGGEAPIECTDERDHARNFIVFDDPCEDIDPLEGCTGVLAFGGPISSGTHRHEGETWSTIVAWVVVVNSGVECVGRANLRVIIAHELGHGLGFSHVADRGALMYAGCCRLVNETDERCARVAFPSVSSENARPRVSAGTDFETRAEGTTLPGTVIDEDPVDVVWSVLRGPGTVDFADPNAPETEATFAELGEYLLALTADDGELRATDVVRVTVREPPPEPEFVRGDSNDDGTTDLSDAVHTLVYLFLGTVTPGCEKSADSDDNGEIDLTDAVYLLSFLFTAGPPLSAPVTSCGADPTDDDLSCETFAHCNGAG